MTEIIRIPDERTKVLIGKNGETKKAIEDRCRIKLEINDGEVQINGNPADVFFGNCRFVYF